MRYLTIFGMFILATVLCLSVTSSAQQAPGGSYQQSCRDIGVRGSTLYAECQDTGGGWRQTELRDYRNCGSEIQNINGNLQCSPGGNDNRRDGNRGDDHRADGDRRGDHHDGDRRDDRDRVPRGSYVQTCQNIVVSGNTLQASCQKKNSSWRQTSLRNYSQCRDISNNNGKLRCIR